MAVGKDEVSSSNLDSSSKKNPVTARVPPHKDNNKIPFRAMQEGGNRYTFGCRPLVL